MFKRNKRGQNVAEYSILIALVVAAAVAMNTYVKRSLQGRVKDASDARIGVPSDLNFTWNHTQYEPYYTDANSTLATRSNRNETTHAWGSLSREGIDEGTTRMSGSYESSLAPSSMSSSND